MKFTRFLLATLNVYAFNKGIEVSERLLLSL